MTRLFAVAKQNLYHTQDGVNIPSQAVLTARSQVDCLLNNHGEALIEALEANVAVLQGFEAGLLRTELSALRSAQALLAQLESEAQP